MTSRDVKSQKCSNKTIYNTYLNGWIHTSYAWTTKKPRQTYIPPAGQTTLTIIISANSLRRAKYFTQRKRLFFSNKKDPIGQQSI